MYMFFGDSHSRQFVGTSWGIFCHYIFSGATVKGLQNESSVTGHSKIIRHALSYERNKSAFLMFGSVDFDLTLIRGLCNGEVGSATSFAIQRADTYHNFVQHLIRTTPFLDNIIVLGPQVSPLTGETFFHSTIQQIGIGITESELRGYADRQDISDIKRAQHIINFNDLLHDRFSHLKNVQFLRIDRDMVDQNLSIKPEFVPKPPGDHHASAHETQRLWRPLLLEKITERVIVG